MAYELEPRNTPEWKRITECENYEEAFILCRRYIAKLQDKITMLETSNATLRSSVITVEDIIKPSIIKQIESRAVKEYISTSSQDWSGVQGGY